MKMNLNDMRNVRLPQASGPAGTLARLALIGGVGLYAAFNSLYNVEGGHRAIVFNRLVGVKDKVCCFSFYFFSPSGWEGFRCGCSRVLHWEGFICRCSRVSHWEGFICRCSRVLHTVSFLRKWRRRGEVLLSFVCGMHHTITPVSLFCTSPVSCSPIVPKWVKLWRQ